MPGYDSNLDQKLFSKAWEQDGVRLTVSVFSYNKGTQKLQVSRENVDEEGNARFSKLGRMTQGELEGVLPYMKEALEFMQKNPGA